MLWLTVNCNTAFFSRNTNGPTCWQRGTRFSKLVTALWQEASWADLEKDRGACRCLSAALGAQMPRALGYRENAKTGWCICRNDLQGAKQSCLNKPLAKSRAFTEVYPGISYLVPAAGSGYVPCHVWWLTWETTNCSAAGAQWWWSYTRSHQTAQN